MLLKSLKVSWYQLNYKNNGLALLLKTISAVCCRLLARMKMESNLKKLGQFFQVLMLCS